jgi:hypothetical protein
MRKIAIKIWPGGRNGMWCVEINGNRHGPTTFDVIQDVVRHAVAELKRAMEAEETPEKQGK